MAGLAGVAFQDYPQRLGEAQRLTEVHAENQKAATDPVAAFLILTELTN
jgi:hypothetical protein